MTKYETSLLAAWAIGIIVLTAYSYSQIDLNLTLFQGRFYQQIQSFLIQLGYYHRPLSSLIYILLTGYFWILYRLALSPKNTMRLIKYLLLINGILILAYPAWSHDIFNYIFDTRILLLHQANPYLTKALDFPLDPWTRFMHWTHRTYPYGPIWLALTVPFYLVGLGKFSLTLFSFKSMMYLSYAGTAWLVYQLTKIKRNQGLTSLLLITLNPFILYEVLVAGHHDLVMMFLALLSFFLLTKRRFGLSLLILLVSIGIKFVTVVFLPVYIFYIWQVKHQKKVSLDKMAVWLMAALLLAVIYVSVVREFQAWYLVWPLTFAVLLPTRKTAQLVINFSLTQLVQYLPFLYYGEWGLPVKNIKTYLVWGGLLIAFFLTYGWPFMVKNIAKKPSAK